MTKTILLFGGSGMLGTRIKDMLSSKYNIFAPSHKDIDILIQKQIENSLETTKYDFIVYAAGETNQDIAEQNQDIAIKLNAKIPGFIAKKSSRLGIPLIYLSTDAVFGGDKETKKYKETDRVSPVNYYGLTKAKGEELILNTSTGHLILRLAPLYSALFSKKLDLVRKVIYYLDKGKNFKGITDQFFNPIFVDNVVLVLDSFFQKYKSGIFHIAATDYINNYGFSKKIAKFFDFDEKMIIPETLSNFLKDKKAIRPYNSILDVSKYSLEFPNVNLGSIDQNLIKFKSLFLNPQ